MTNIYTAIHIFFIRSELKVAVSFALKTMYSVEQMQYFPQAEYNDDIKKSWNKKN